MSEPRKPGDTGKPDRSILHQLAQDARVIRGARMLPNDRPLTPQEIEGVARDFGRWLKESRRSMGSISKALGEGFSHSVLSQFTGAVYKGDNERVARAVNAYMGEQARKAEAVPLPGFVETEVAKIIITAIRLAIDNSAMAEIIGPAGVGKSMTARAVEKMIPGTIYLRVTEGNRRGPGLVHEMCRTLGIASRTTYSSALVRAREALAGSSRPIIVDEAHRATMTALEAIRDLYDDTLCPVILMGTKDLQRRTNDASMFYGQFASRIIATVDVTEEAGRSRRGRGVRPLFSVDDIIAVFARQGVRLTDDGAEFLCSLASIPGIGGLRVCCQLVRVAARHRDYRDKALPASILRAVLRQLHDATYIQRVQSEADRLRIDVQVAAAG